MSVKEVTMITNAIQFECFGNQPPMTLKRICKIVTICNLLLTCFALATTAYGQQSESQVYKELGKSTYWVHPSFNKVLNLNQVKDEAEKSKPYDFKLLAVPGLGSKWIKNGKENRAEFAKYVSDKQLKLGDQGILIVLTRKGVSAYNPRLSSTDLQALNSQAAKQATKNNLTPAVINLAEQVRGASENAKSLGTSVAPSGGIVDSTQGSGSGAWALLCFAIPVALIALVIGLVIANNKKVLQRSKNAADQKRRQAIEAISYIDSYDGLLTDSADKSATLQYRQRMGENFDIALTTFNRANSKQDFDRATFEFQRVIQDFEGAKNSLNAATGGSGIAYSIPPIIDNERAPLFEPVKGVSYFSSQPSELLVPVEVNFGGSRKTVMVTPEERDELMAGRMPQLRGQNINGRFTPWYGVNGYDPYRDYYSGNFVWDLLAINMISSMFMPSYGFGWGGGLFGGHHYHSWGYDGGHYYGDYYSDGLYHGHHHGGYDDNGYGGSSDFDMGNNDSGGDFDFGTDSNDSGGFGFGGFDFGGGDDSGGGFDFGGGDFGGGDFGGD